jgi:hypothetical protein
MLNQAAKNRFRNASAERVARIGITIVSARRHNSDSIAAEEACCVPARVLGRSAGFLSRPDDLDDVIAIAAPALFHIPFANDSDA